MRALPCICFMGRHLALLDCSHPAHEMRGSDDVAKFFSAALLPFSSRTTGHSGGSRRRWPAHHRID